MQADSDAYPFATVETLGRAYRSGQVSPVDVVAQCLARMERYDEALNAVIAPLGEAALARAEQLAAELRRGADRGPMHGVPVGIKDIIDVAGVPTTFASRALDPVVPARSAPLVENLERSGAIVIAKTNLLEFAYGSVHPEVGQTNNPWLVSRTSGGSSGGSGAGVSAGFFHAAVGTDTGGSIRGPASYCGIAGLKPTYGLVDTTGVFPLSWSLDHAGPMARTPACAHAMLDAMSGRTSLAAPVPIAGLRASVVAAHRGEPALHDDVANAFDAALHNLEAGGVSLVETPLPDFSGCDQALLDVLMPEASVIHERIHAGRPDGYGPDTRHNVELGFELKATAYVKGQRFRDTLRAEVEAVFDRVDLLLGPTVAWVAPAEDPAVSGDDGSVEMRFVAPWNLTGHPTLSLPCGFGDQGLPVGLQIVARLGDDARLLRIAESIHRHFGLPLEPTGLDPV